MKKVAIISVSLTSMTPVWPSVCYKEAMRGNRNEQRSSMSIGAVHAAENPGKVDLKLIEA